VGDDTGSSDRIARVRLDPVLSDLRERDISGSRGPIYVHYFLFFFV